MEWPLFFVMIDFEIYYSCSLFQWSLSYSSHLPALVIRTFSYLGTVGLYHDIFLFAFSVKVENYNRLLV